MPKRVFWPIAMIVMGLIFLASILGLLPMEFIHLWPLILIVVGLGGLLTADREEWIWQTKKAPVLNRKSNTKITSARRHRR